jgi:hypothetical protein
MSRILTEALKCLAVLALIGNLCFLTYRFLETKPTSQPPEPPRPDAERRNLIVLKNDEQVQALGLETEEARAGSWRERTPVYGRVVANPRAVYEVRAPFAGTLRTIEGAAWPAPGEAVQRGQALGQLLVRVSPLEKLDLESKLSEALNAQQGAKEIIRVRSAVLERLTKTNGVSVPQRELDEARVQMVEAQTQQAKADAAVELWKRALQEVDAAPRGGPWLRPLHAPTEPLADAALEVADVAATPGSAVEASGLLLRLVDVGRPLLRLDLPPALAEQASSPEEIEIQSLSASSDAAPVRAKRLGPAAQIDAGSQTAGVLYQIEGLTEPTTTPDAETMERLRSLRRLWRPGLFVRADLPRPGEAQDAVSVPGGALLYHQGRALVYVCVKPRQYERREVRVLGRLGDRWALAPRGLLEPDVVSVRPGEKIVSSEAQSLLSLEFRRDADDD